MRILVDEDTAVQVVDALRQLLPGHQIDHIHITAVDPRHRFEIIDPAPSAPKY